MSDDGRRQAVTKPAVRAAPAPTLPGLAAAPPPPAPPASARPIAPTLPGHAATTPAVPGRPAAAMSATPPAATSAMSPMSDGGVEIDVFAAPTPTSGRRRTIALAVGGAAVVVVALVVGLRPARHAGPANVAPPKAAPPPAVVVAPLEAPAAPQEIAAAPAEPTRAPAPTAKKSPRVRHRPVAHREREAAPQRRGPAHKRLLAKKEARKEKPAGDREAARAAYQRGSDLLLTGNAAGAVDAYQEAVRLAPADPVGYRGLGLAYEKEGKTKDAIASLVAYLKLSRHAHDREVIARRLYRLTHSE